MDDITRGMTDRVFLHIAEYWEISSGEGRNEDCVMEKACWTWSFQKVSRSRRDVPITSKASIESFSAWAPLGRKVASDICMKSVSEVPLLVGCVPALNNENWVRWIRMARITGYMWLKQQHRWKLLHLHAYIPHYLLLVNPQHRRFPGQGLGHD